MKAASLLEMLIVLGIFSTMVMIAFPYSLKLINQNRADAVTKQIAYEIFHQQQDAYSGNGAKTYGIAFYSDHIVSYVGTSLATAESTFPITLDVPITISGISFGANNELLFNSGSFRPITPGYLTVTDTTKTYRVDVNKEGLISYYVQ